MEFSPAFFISAITGLVLLLAGFITRQWPPKKINDLDGYRTKRSMANQQTWDFAQRFCGVVFKRSGLALLAISGLFVFLPMDYDAGAIIALIISIGACLMPLLLVERELQRRFGAGKRQ